VKGWKIYCQIKKVKGFTAFINKIKINDKFSVFSKKPAVIVIININ